MRSGPFYVHLADAIAENTRRRPIYARLSRGRSTRLSHVLVFLERMLLPVAAWVDWRARPFLRRGIPIVADDFMPMHPLPPPERPPRFRGRTAEGDLARLGRAIARYGEEVRDAARRADFEAAGAVSYDVLVRVERLEEASRSHLAMMRHIIESIGLAAVNAPRWAAASGGETVPLSCGMLRIQTLGLFDPLGLDRMAQAVHERGAGIIWNDVPAIPFKERWLARREGPARAPRSAGAAPG